MLDELLSKVIKVNNVHIKVVELPFNSPIHLPFGDVTTRPSAWFTIEAEVDGKLWKGAAEGTALPMTIPMYDDCSSNLRHNITQIVNSIGRRATCIGDALQVIGSIDLSGNFATARMTVEAAILDLAARTESRSIVSYLDGKPSDDERDIPYGKSIAESEKNSIIMAANNAFNFGAKRLKFKLSPKNYSELYAALRVIQKSYPNVDCMVDANGMFDPHNEEHIDMLRSIDELQLLTIEEPVSRTGKVSGLDAHRMLASVIQLKTPITIDDAIKSLDDARTALDEGLANTINLKPGRMGSFIKCLEIAKYAKSRGKEVMVGGMFEATPGRMMTLSLAAYCIQQGFMIPGDLSLPQERLETDLVDPILCLDENNNIVFKPNYGWGYKL